MSSRIERTGFVGFVNNIQMTAFAGFNGQVLWFFGSIVLTLVDAYLLTRQADQIRLTDILATDIKTEGMMVYQMKLNAIVSIFSAHNTAAEQMRQAGLWLAGFLLGGWTGKSVSNAWSNKVIRESAQEYAPVAEAKARGKAAGQLVVQPQNDPSGQQMKTEVNVNGGTPKKTDSSGALNGDDERGEG